jgi:hypothetical protein
MTLNLFIRTTMEHDHILRNKPKLEQILYVLTTLRNRVKICGDKYSINDGICSNAIIMFNCEFYSDRDWGNRLKVWELVEIFCHTCGNNNIKLKNPGYPVYHWLGNERKYLQMSGRHNMWRGCYGRRRIKFLKLVIKDIENIISTL